jgi:hypothetical protein
MLQIFVLDATPKIRCCKFLYLVPHPKLDAAKYALAFSKQINQHFIKHSQDTVCLVVWNREVVVWVWILELYLEYMSCLKRKLERNVRGQIWLFYESVPKGKIHFFRSLFHKKVPAFLGSFLKVNFTWKWKWYCPYCFRSNRLTVRYMIT